MVSPCPLQAHIIDHDAPILEKPNNECHTGAGTIEVPLIFISEFQSLKSVEESQMVVFHLLYSDIFIPSPEERPPRFKNY